MQRNGSLLEMETAIQEATNAVGCCVTEEALRRFDADGSPIRVGEIKSDPGALDGLIGEAATNTVGRWAQFWQKIDQFGAECYC